MKQPNIYQTYWLASSIFLIKSAIFNFPINFPTITNLFLIEKLRYKLFIYLIHILFHQLYQEINPYEMVFELLIYFFV